ncbi:MAG: STAS domain-containing protein [Verrucomicrobia bacterium]|nr:STAS domain-containing protein [Verrucomicrobiota bacterium]
MNGNSSILVGVAPEAVWVQVRGRGSFQNSSCLKAFATEMIQRGHREFVVDLEECPMMDSTFMGTLTGIALKLKNAGSGEIHVVNSNARNQELMSGLGLDQILRVGDCPQARQLPASTDRLVTGDLEKRATNRTMLDAHEALCRADAANVSKFKDVLDFLRQDLGVTSTPINGGGASR